MTLPSVVAFAQRDPILVAFSIHYPINPDVLERAIVYREALIDDIREEIAILQKTIARLRRDNPVGAGPRACPEPLEEEA